MESKIMFLIIAILLLFALFSKTGIATIKNLIGVVQSSASAIPNNWGTNTQQAPTAKGGNGNSAGSGANTSPAGGSVA